jgi:hypothetical protein
MTRFAVPRPSSSRGHSQRARRSIRNRYGRIAGLGIAAVFGCTVAASALATGGRAAGGARGEAAELALVPSPHVPPDTGVGRTAARLDTLAQRTARLAGAEQDRADPPSADRAFRHARHDGLSCLQCHGTGLGHRTVTLRGSAECGACHHDPRQRFVCGDCHARADLPRTRSVPTVLALSVWSEARIRTIPFSHERHLPVACGTCHGMPLARAEVPACTSCHAEHHRPEAECTTCHAAVPQEAHGAEAHLGCAGTGCHAPASAPLPIGSRTLCLACHVAQSTHEPERSCDGCHMIPPVPEGAATVTALQRRTP